jgi:hypothetical protein
MGHGGFAGRMLRREVRNFTKIGFIAKGLASTKLM